MDAARTQSSVKSTLDQHSSVMAISPEVRLHMTVFFKAIEGQTGS